MHYIITVAETGSVSQAANSLYIPQSALSRYIKYVEDDLGVKLFDRSTTPITLTFAGKCYVETAREILRANDRLPRELRYITRHMTGSLTIGTSRDRAAYMMPKLLPGFKAGYPGIQVFITTGSGRKLREDLAQGNADILLLPERGKEESFIASQVIYSEELLLAAKKGTLSLNGKSAVHAIRSSGLPFFMQYPEHTIRIFCERYFKSHRLKPDIAMEIPGNIACYRMAAAGLGLAVIPYMTTRLANADDAELLSLDDEPVTWNILALYRKDAYIGEPEHELILMAQDIFSAELNP